MPSVKLVEAGRHMHSPMNEPNASVTLNDYDFTRRVVRVCRVCHKDIDFIDEKEKRILTHQEGVRNR